MPNVLFFDASYFWVLEAAERVLLLECVVAFVICWGFSFIFGGFFVGPLVFRYFVVGFCRGWWGSVFVGVVLLLRVGG